jgi:citrate lyase gamma subunit
MAGRELILPATVLASHLEFCAAELAADPAAPDDLAQVVGQLVAGQRHIAATLARLAVRLDSVPVADRAALAEVLRASARATGHAADALAESEHMFE